MKILYFLDHFLPSIGGVEVFCGRLIQSSIQDGHEAAIVTDMVGMRDRHEDRVSLYCKTPLYRFPLSQIVLQRNLSTIKAVVMEIVDLINSFNPDVIHIHTALSSPIWMIYWFLRLQLHREKVLITIHGAVPELFDSGRTPDSITHCLVCADHLNFVSQGFRNRYLRHLSFPIEKTSVIHNGLPAPNILVRPLQFDPVHCLCLGRVTNQKGFEDAIVALKWLVKKYPDVTLTIAGDGPELPRLKCLAENLQLTASIHFLGWVEPEKVYELINTMDIMLMPSVFEPFGLVALQAAQMARPVIATRVEGLPEVVIDGETGLLVEHNSPKALAAAVEKLIEDKEWAIRLGQEALSRARRYFSMDRCFAEYKKCYETLLEHAELKKVNV